jgi:hypothetical protein
MVKNSMRYYLILVVASIASLVSVAPDASVASKAQQAGKEKAGRLRNPA